MVFRSIHSLVLISLSAAMLVAQTTSSSPQKTLLGFDREGSDRERAVEKQFDSLLRKENLREWMKRLSARPHHLGSPYGKENAEFIAGLFRSWGYETEIERFDVLFPAPKTRLLEMTSPEKFTAKLEEPALKEDTTSGQKSEQLPVYNAYSVNGDVTGQLVYVNYGVPQDYEELERRGVDVKGKIVIARYGGSWRGIKPKLPPSMAPSAASFTPTRATTAFLAAMSIRKARGETRPALSAVPSPTCRSILAIRSRRASVRRQMQNGSRSTKRPL